MARYYRRRYTRTIVRAPKKKWCSNILDVIMETPGAGVSHPVATLSSSFMTLAENKTEANSPTPVVIKTGNVKFQADLHFAKGSTASTSAEPVATLYIVYVPQGWLINTAQSASSLVANHPEWIMAWKVLESVYVTAVTSIDDSSRFTITSRLKRNLNSGDSVAAIVIYDNLPEGITGVIRGKCQFWTCAN